MTDQTKERWFQLCALAAVENDPAKLLALVTEVNRLLMEKEQLLSPSESAEMRRTWRDIAREVDQELDFTRMLAMTAKLNQTLLEGETRAGTAPARADDFRSMIRPRC
jgi:hypothetical protein